jgi:hypothetical protein
MVISNINEDKSLADDLDQRGIVSGRVALLLRSAEIKPLLNGFVTIVTLWSTTLTATSLQ